MSLMLAPKHAEYFKAQLGLPVDDPRNDVFELVKGLTNQEEQMSFIALGSHLAGIGSPNVITFPDYIMLLVGIVGGTHAYRVFKYSIEDDLDGLGKYMEDNGFDFGSARRIMFHLGRLWMFNDNTPPWLTFKASDGVCEEWTDQSQTWTVMDLVSRKRTRSEVRRGFKLIGERHPVRLRDVIKLAVSTMILGETTFKALEDEDMFRELFDKLTLAEMSVLFELEGR